MNVVRLWYGQPSVLVEWSRVTGAVKQYVILKWSGPDL